MSIFFFFLQSVLALSVVDTPNTKTVAAIYIVQATTQHTPPCLDTHVTHKQKKHAHIKKKDKKRLLRKKYSKNSNEKRNSGRTLIQSKYFLAKRETRRHTKRNSEFWNGTHLFYVLEKRTSLSDIFLGSKLYSHVSSLPAITSNRTCSTISTMAPMPPEP